jgi:hypothetical protein
LSFDLVIFHASVDALAAADPSMRDAGALAAFLGRVARVLSAGGVLAVCARSASVLARWRRAGLAAAFDRGRDDALLPLGGWRTALATAGLSRVQSFSVLPGASAPLRLINTDADLSRIGFRRELQSLRSSLSWPGYVARLTMAQLALNRYLEEWVLAWGQRP